jgi:hypothetical protein
MRHLTFPEALTIHYGVASQKGKPKTTGLARLGCMARDPIGDVRFFA